MRRMSTKDYYSPGHGLGIYKYSSSAEDAKWLSGRMTLLSQMSLRKTKQMSHKEMTILQTSLGCQTESKKPSKVGMADDGYISPSDEHEHFPTLGDRAKSSTRNVTRSGRISPAHSAHGNLIRSTLMNSQVDRKAKKVRFYRNGDRFFRGTIYAVSPERFRTFESLMAELTSSPVCDKTVLPNGVRHIFSVDGSRKITSLDELREGESYVCASTQAFRKIDYPRTGPNPYWNVNTNAKNKELVGGIMYREQEENREYIRPRLVTVVRSGSKPRRAIRILLNKKTAHSFDQVLTDITEAIKLDSGTVKKIFTLNGKPVTSLPDFFGEETVFIAYGAERYALDDFDLDNNEISFVSAYKSVRNKERISLKSPKPPRRMPMTPPTKSLQEQGLEIPSRKSSAHSAASPKMPRKFPPAKRSHSPNMSKVGNGHLTTNGDSEIVEGPTELLTKYKIGPTIGDGNFAVVKECTENTNLASLKAEIVDPGTNQPLQPMVGLYQGQYPLPSLQLLTRERKKKYALKVINKSKCKGKEQMIENEVSILRRVKHRNIIQLVEEFDTDTHLYLVMELVKGGDLFDAISSATKYTERDASGMLFNLMSAIRYLHSLFIAHRDIKPENLLVCEHSDGSKSLKLGDFGLATEIRQLLYTVCGTPTYVAPEILAETGYGLKIDVWSAGVITYILLCGFPPFVSSTNDQDELFDKIVAGQYQFTSPFWDDISQPAKQLISHMMHIDPVERYSAEEVLDHPWVAEDMAKDEDMHVSVATKLGENFVTKSKQDQPAIALITTTALDNQSRYFQGRGQLPAVREFENHNGEDEVF